MRAVSVTNAAETLVLSGVYSGTGGGITKSGSGVLTLSGANTYTGPNVFVSGALAVTSLTSSGANGSIGVPTSAARHARMAC